MDTWEIHNQTLLFGEIEDVSTAGQIYIPCPFAGEVIAVHTVLNGAIGTADADLTVKDDDGNAMGVITIATASSAAGDKDSLTTIANADVAAGDSIEIETDGASSNAVKVFICVVLQRS